MRILISNDDGIFAKGIRTLADALADADHEVIVVCPDRERSATGHGLTLHKPIRAELVTSLFQSSVKAWACSGTPADCVKLALGALLDRPPDLVLSGINHGANLGTDILYSGTVSAAMEGTIEGIPAIALSLASFSWQDFQPAAQFARSFVDQLAQTSLADAWLLNINIPPRTSSTIRGVQITRQGVRRYFDQFEKRVDPRGKTYYWLAGEVVEEVQESALGSWTEDMRHALSAFPTDVQGVRDGYISITPLQYNLTALTGLLEVHNWMSAPGKLFAKFNQNI